MTKFTHPFDPLLAQQYSERVKECEQQITDTRQLFYLLNQPVKVQDVLFSAYQFVDNNIRDARQYYSVNQAGSGTSVSRGSGEAKASFPDYEQIANKGKFDTLKVIPIAPLPEALQTQDNFVNFVNCVNQAAAISLTQPCWLQNISQISSSQVKSAVQMMSVYLQMTGSRGQGSVDLQGAYRSLILATGGKTPCLYSVGYSQQTNIITEMFDFACIQLALAQFPRVLFPEILGFTLAFCQMPSIIEICFSDYPYQTSFFQTRKQLLHKQIPFVNQCITDYLALFPQYEQEIRVRIKNGHELYQLQMLHCREQFNKSLLNQLSPSQSVAHLLQQKKQAAIGHHQQVKLAGITLDKWFAGMPGNHKKFLKALKQSNYVDQQQPTNSKLLKLFEFKSPMYGVLDETELLIIKKWLLDDSNQQLIHKNEEIVNPVNCSDMKNYFPASFYLKAKKKYFRLSNRELYFYLINEDLFADVLPVARNKVKKLLRLCTFFKPLPFKHYSHQQLDCYIEKLYQREIAAYKPLQGKPKISKTAYIWGLEQVAPMILIDGCWLQNTQILQNLYPEISRILYSIYCDETGNGKLEQNHPYIFQQLLDSLSIKVPAVYAKEFVQHKGFINSAFDLPVYMLSLSHFTVEFLPELLGLNMAIELSGLGKAYMNLVDEWKYWQIDPTIAEIHISIDNYASGHTMLAKKAIQLYMDSVMQSTQDRAILDKHWRRIYSGFASLTFVGARFKLSLPVCYLVNKM